MPYNGTGTFVRLYNWVTDAANGIFVRNDRMDAEMDGMATALSDCITRDGQSPATANLPMGGFKLTGLAAGSAPADSVNYLQAFTAPTFTGGITFSGGAVGTGTINFSGATAVTVPTVATSDSSTNAASTFYVNQKAFLAALPAQPGTALPFKLRTLSGTASWVSDAMLSRAARTSNTILDASVNGYLVDATSGSFTQTLTAAATLANSWYVFYRNSGTGDITLDPNGSELIDGLTSYIMYPGECRLIMCDGTGFYSMVITPFARECSANFSGPMPPGYKALDTELFGAGGAGGSGRGNAGGAVAILGGAGGGGGAYVRRVIPVAEVGATITLVIGTGGTGPSGTVNADGTIGGAGTATTLNSTLLVAGGGFGGQPGAAGAQAVGGLGGKSCSDLAAVDPIGGGSAGGASQSGGAGGAVGGRQLSGPGGGAGGSDTAANVLQNPSDGGKRGVASGGGGAAGTSSAAAPTAGTAGGAFQGGGGGGSSKSVTGGTGGAGGIASGGGGGGSAENSGTTGGTGGNGGPGYAIIRGV
jgi:hypothetical protein